MPDSQTIACLVKTLLFGMVDGKRRQIIILNWRHKGLGGAVMVKEEWIE